MLNTLLLNSAEKYPAAIAVTDANGSYTYSALVAEGARIAHGLRSMGVQPSDRVAIWMKKSFGAIATMHAVLQLGAIYVPLDPVGPVKRARTIIGDCDVTAVVHDRASSEDVLAEGLVVPTLSYHPDAAVELSWNDLAAYPHTVEPVPREPDDLAYILYTSGSTGTPKGVCITHRNALAFVDWAAVEVGVATGDRLANHAPFHFDLSVFDIYAAFHGGASVHIIPESIAYLGNALSTFVVEQKITIWYSVPTAIMMMCDNGELLQSGGHGLRTLIFAGEVFPIKKLSQFQETFPKVRLLNFFGPTETNVCTFYDVQEDLQHSDQPLPIGVVCSGNEAWVEMENGELAVNVEDEGELIIRGPTVMAGYWGKPMLPHGCAYPTGDLVRLLPGGGFYYLGRKDSMIKIQGYRVELGEIEAVLGLYPGIENCAVVVASVDGRAELVAFIEYLGEKQPSIIQLKMHCATSLPQYMVIHRAICIDAMPRTANGKIDRLTLKNKAFANV